MPDLRKSRSKTPCLKSKGLLNPRCKYSWVKWLFPITGLISLIWFLVRVIPKPSRAAYPCQRVAAPLASAFIVWLLAVIASVSAFRKAKDHVSRSRPLIAGICILVSIGSVWLALSITAAKLTLADDPIPNTPIGVAKGLHPGRVVWIYDPNATDWDGPGSEDGYWWEPGHTNQHFVDDMMSRAIRELSGRPGDANAWNAIFTNFNSVRGKGDLGYRAGERITIKVNLTTCNRTLWTVNPANYDKEDYLDKVDTAPQMIVALLRQLVYKVGVHQSDITVGDTSAYFPNHYWSICHAEFPDVRYLDPDGRLGRTKAEYSTIVQHWSHGESTPYKTDYVPCSFAEADYIINFACLKGHAAGVTLCAKNHYGSYIRLPTASGYFNLHSSLAGAGFDPITGHYRALVDIMGHPHMGGKTLLYMIDGLYGGYYWEGTPHKWQMPPFNGDWPSSLFVSQDPVAIDSVGLDFLWQEWPHVARVAGVDDYLHEAALADIPPSGTSYDPDGDEIGLQSLGAHEHWNNATDKQYSRNLGTADGIELISFMLTNHSPQVDAGSDQTVIPPQDTVNLEGTVSDDGLPVPPGAVTAIWSKVAGAGKVAFGDANSVMTTATFSGSGVYQLRLTADDGELSNSDHVIITVVMPGDFEPDGDVDFDDLAELVASWLHDEPSADIAPYPAGDGIVNFQDFAALADNWLAGQ